MYYAYTTRKIEDTEALRWQRAKPSRSKPNIVNWPVRTARTFVQHYNSTQYCSTETVFLIFAFLHTNITSQMWPSGGKGITHMHFPNIEVKTRSCIWIQITPISHCFFSWCFQFKDFLNICSYVCEQTGLQSKTNKQTNKQRKKHNHPDGNKNCFMFLHWLW